MRGGGVGAGDDPGQLTVADPWRWHPPLTTHTSGTNRITQPLPGSPAGNGCILGRGRILKCERPVQMLLRCVYMEMDGKG